MNTNNSNGRTTAAANNLGHGHGHGHGHGPLGHSLRGGVPNHFSPSHGGVQVQVHREDDLHQNHHHHQHLLSNINHSAVSSLGGSVAGSAGGLTHDDVESITSSEDPNAPAKHDFMVSFLVDARGGSMVGCRHSGVKASFSSFITRISVDISHSWQTVTNFSSPPSIL